MIHSGVVDGNLPAPLQPPPNSSLPPSPIVIGNTRNSRDVGNNDYENARISNSSFSKGFTFLEKQRKETLFSPPKSSTSPLSKKESHHQSSSPPPSSLPSLFSSFSSSSSSSSPKKPERKKDGDTFLSSSSLSLPDDSEHSIASLKQSIIPLKKRNINGSSNKNKKTTKKKDDNDDDDDDKEKKTMKKKRCVTFNRKVRIRKISRIVDMDIEDLEATYYSPEEMIDMRNMLRAKIRVIIEDQQQQEQQKNVCCGAYNDNNCDCFHNSDCHYDDDDDKYDGDDGDGNDYDEYFFCLRGLEPEFPNGKQRRRRNKTISRDVVLEEQQYWCNRNEIKDRSRCCGKQQQQLQHDGDVDDEDPIMAIAEAYRTESMPALHHALDTAKNDEFIAKRIYNNKIIRRISNTTASTASSSLPSSSSSSCSWTERDDDDNDYGCDNENNYNGGCCDDNNNTDDNNVVRHWTTQ